MDPSTKPAPTRLLGMLTAIGPGIVVTGSVMGSGELINTPVQAAKFGFVLLWAVIVSCVIKYFLQVEFGRHALAHHRTPFETLNIIPGPKLNGTCWVGLAYMVGFAFALLSFTGMLRATAGLLHTLLPLSSQLTTSVDLWAVIVGLATLLLLWRGVYGEMELLVTLLVCGFSLSVVMGVFLLQKTDYRISGEQFLSGFTFSLGEQPRLAAYAVISLLGALGATANEIFMYPYWVLEKGYAAHVGPQDSPGWTERARGWIRILQLDVAVCTSLATVITAAYFVMGAAVFFGRGDVPSGDEILVRLSAMFTESFGGWSRGIFVVGAFCTLFSTLLVGIAAAGRMWTDMLVSLQLLDGSNQRSIRRSHRVIELLYVLASVSIGVSLRQPPEKLVILGQYVTGLFCTPLLMIAICWIAFRTDRRVRMSPLSAVFLLGSVGVITICIVGSLALQSGWFGQ